MMREAKERFGVFLRLPRDQFREEMVILELEKRLEWTAKYCEDWLGNVRADELIQETLVAMIGVPREFDTFHEVVWYAKETLRNIARMKKRKMRRLKEVQSAHDVFHRCQSIEGVDSESIERFFSFPLSEMEYEIAVWVAKGYGLCEIPEMTGLSEDDVLKVTSRIKRRVRKRRVRSFDARRRPR